MTAKATNKKTHPKRIGAGKPGPGRPKGVKNKATAEREAKIAKSGKTPLQFLLDGMRDKNLDEDVRRDYAKAAAPYVHPKLAAVHTTQAPEKTHEEWLREVKADREQDDAAG